VGGGGGVGGVGEKTNTSQHRGGVWEAPGVAWGASFLSPGKRPHPGGSLPRKVAVGARGCKGGETGGGGGGGIIGCGLRGGGNPLALVFVHLLKTRGTILKRKGGGGGGEFVALGKRAPKTFFF